MTILEPPVLDFFNLIFIYVFIALRQGLHKAVDICIPCVCGMTPVITDSLWNHELGLQTNFSLYLNEVTYERHIMSADI